MTKAVTIVGHRVLVNPDPVEKKSEGGIVLPGEWDERRHREATHSGVVLQVGNLAFKDLGNGEPWCKVGDRIIYARHAGKFIKNPNDSKEEWYMINDEDVQGILTEEKNND